MMRTCKILTGTGRAARYFIGVFVALVATLSLTGTAAAAGSCSSPVVSGSYSVVTCSYAGALQSWQVPSNVNSVTFDVQGARGGYTADATASNQVRGGYGGEETGTLAVSAGQTFTIMVGGVGASTQTGSTSTYGKGGYGGGGDGGSDSTASGDTPGAGGGGGSFVFDGSGNPVIVAGGGGGAWSRICSSYSSIIGGGGGGGATGDSLASYASSSCTNSTGLVGSEYGGGGTRTGGGTGGVSPFDAGYPQIDGATGSGPASNSGSLTPGQGGTGGTNYDGGGGGGGGYYGGGGGDYYAAGGGGSGYLSPSLTSTSSQNNVNPYEGTVTITYLTPAAPAITSGSSTWFSSGQSNSFKVTTTGGPAPSLAESGYLPSSVKFVDNGDGTATLSATPTAADHGQYIITVTATNSMGSKSQQFTLNIGQTPAFTSASSATFTVGKVRGFNMSASGDPTPTLTETGTLPSGVTFSTPVAGTAQLSGTPAAGTAGTYSIVITASNGDFPDAKQYFTLTVDQAPTISSSSSSTFTVGQARSFTVTSTGTPSATFSESGALPSGVTLVSNGDGTATLSGTPATGSGGTYPITITAANGVSPDATQSFTLTVDEAAALTSARSTTFAIGQAGSFTVSSTGFPAATLSESGNLPNGVTFVDKGNDTATLSGTPTSGSTGTYSITITASNGISSDATQSFTLTVDQAPAISSASSTTFMPGRANSFTVTSTGFPAATLSESGALPSGVTFIDNGDGTATLSGVPAAGSVGTYSITITAADGTSPDATESFTLTVAGPVLSGLRVSPRSFVLAGRLVGGQCRKATKANRAHNRCKRSIELHIRYRLGTAATVSFRVEKRVPGRKVNGRCVRRTKENRYHKRCESFVKLRGKIKRASHAGLNRFTWNGKLGKHQLRPGRYKLIATPIHGKPRTVSFRIKS